MSDEAMGKEDRSTPQSETEGRARRVIDDLVQGRVRPRTVDDLSDAVGKAKRDGAVGRIGGRH